MCLPSSSNPQSAILSLLFTLTLFVSAALLFLVQPLVARLVLPLLGGTPAVWNTCMVFFQAVLLAGYAYAHVTPKWLGPRRQPLLHLLLLPLPLLVLPFALPANATPPESVPIFWLLGLLLLLAGLPFFVVSTSAPLLQRWFADTGHSAASDPYFLYAASNLGSILALAAYPVVVEPLLGLTGQGRLWTIGYGVLAILIVCCAVALWRSPSVATDATVQEAPPLRWGQRLHWVLLAFGPSSLMLSVTTYITTDIAAIPLLWVAPLTVYLLTFVVAFSRKQWLPHRGVVRLVPFVVLMVVFLLLSEATDAVKGAGGVWLLVGLHLFGLFWVALLCHGELARTRPASRHLTEFYFWMSLGGVLGGLFNALAAPLLFTSLLEYPLVLVLACALRPLALTMKKGITYRFSWLDLLLPMGAGILTAALIVGFRFYGFDMNRIVNVRIPGFDLNRLNVGLIFAPPLVLCYMMQSRPPRHALGLAALLLASWLYPGVHGAALYRTRSFFGVHRVTQDAEGKFRVLVHGNIVHGKQSLDPEHAGEPLTYYHRTGPAGRVFATLKGDKRLERVGLVGMGTASLCAYAEPGQQWTFYEIDPHVVYIARDSGWFTYFSACEKRCGRRPEVVLGDARLTLARSDARYGLLVIDAFSSDAIPIHLLTREALRVYRDHLTEDGVILFHISNNYLTLEAVLASLASDADPPMTCLVTEDGASEMDKAAGKMPSQWAALAATPEALTKIRRGGWREAQNRRGIAAWRDDYSNLFGVIKWQSEE